MLKRWLLIGIIPFVLLLDQVSKVWVMRRLALGEAWMIWPGVLHLTHVNNTGAAFGILKGSGIILTVVSVICVAGLAVYVAEAFIKNLTSMRSLAGGLVIAGAIGNLVDRVRYGYVIDFIDFRVWPVFNIADVSICTGVGLIAIVLLKK